MSAIQNALTNQSGSTRLTLVAGLTGGAQGFVSGQAGTLTPSNYSGVAVAQVTTNASAQFYFLVLTEAWTKEKFFKIRLTRVSNSVVQEFLVTAAIYAEGGGGASWTWPSQGAMVVGETYLVDII